MTRTDRPRTRPQTARQLALGLMLSLTLGLALTGCDRKASFHSMDVSGASWGQQFELPDTQGQLVRQNSFPGKVTVVFFGFLACPDFCPTHLSKMQSIKSRLGPDGDKLQVVFITLDPERDSAQALQTFLASFDPSFVGLRGSLEQTKAAAQSFRVFFRKAPTGGSGYSIDHTTFAYVFDQTGRLRLVSPHDLPPDQLLEDLRGLIRRP